MEEADAVGGQGFHDRNAGGERGKPGHHEEDEADNDAGHAHGVEDLRQRDEHQTGAGGHALHSGVDEDRRNDHQPGQKGDAGVEDLNVADGAVQVDVILHVGAVGDHDAHGDA